MEMNKSAPKSLARLTVWSWLATYDGYFLLFCYLFCYFFAES
jgi:hypothetical protein